MNATKPRPMLPAQESELKGLLRTIADFDREQAVTVWRSLGEQQRAGTLTVVAAERQISALRQSIRTHSFVAESKRLVESTEKVSAKEGIAQAKARNANPLAAVPAGRYAIDKGDDEISFYRVHRFESGAYVVYVQASDEEHKLDKGPARAALQKILDAGVEASAILYGIKLGVCAICGRALTKKTSRDAGIGPDCAKNFA